MQRRREAASIDGHHGLVARQCSGRLVEIEPERGVATLEFEAYLGPTDEEDWYRHLDRILVVLRSNPNNPLAPEETGFGGRPDGMRADDHVLLSTIANRAAVIERQTDGAGSDVVGWDDDSLDVVDVVGPIVRRSRTGVVSDESVRVPGLSSVRGAEIQVVHQRSGAVVAACGVDVTLGVRPRQRDRHLLSFERGDRERLWILGVDAVHDVLLLRRAVDQFDGSAEVHHAPAERRARPAELVVSKRGVNQDAADFRRGRIAFQLVSVVLDEESDSAGDAGCRHAGPRGAVVLVVAGVAGRQQAVSVRGEIGFDAAVVGRTTAAEAGRRDRSRRCRVAGQICGGRDDDRVLRHRAGREAVETGRAVRGPIFGRRAAALPAVIASGFDPNDVEVVDRFVDPS